MAKMTLLEIVQDILNDIDGDEVNSVNDTIESTQVAQIVKSTYLAMMASKNWPHTRKLIQVNGSGSIAIPTHMTLADSVKEIIFVNYDKAKLSDGVKRKIEDVDYIEVDDFLRISNTRDNTQLNIKTVVDPSSLVNLNIRNDTAPKYYTSFDDKTLVFDSYDSVVDDTLQKSKIQVYAYTTPSWSGLDSSIPDLPEEAFPALIEEAKSKAAFKIRQQPDQKAEQESVRQRRWMARKDWTVSGGIKFPNYGRNSAKSYTDPTFRNEN